MLSQTILSTWIKWSRQQQKKLAQDAVGDAIWEMVQAFMVAREGGSPGVWREVDASGSETTQGEQDDTARL